MTRVTATMTIEREVDIIAPHYSDGDIGDVSAFDQATELPITLTEAEETRARELLLTVHRDNQQAAIERRGDERRDEE